MQTIVIWDECGTASISFFVVNEDWTRFDGIYGNCAYSTEDGEDDVGKNLLADELSQLIYGDDGVFKFEKLAAFPLQVIWDAELDGDGSGSYKVIVAGFLP